MNFWEKEFQSDRVWGRRQCWDRGESGWVLPWLDQEWFVRSWESYLLGTQFIYKMRPLNSVSGLVTEQFLRFHMVETFLRNPVHKMGKMGAALTEGQGKTGTGVRSL